MNIKNKRGQSTVEYILIVTAVIAVIIALITNNGGFSTQINSSINTALGKVSDLSDTMSNSYQQGVQGSGTPGYNVQVNP